MPITGMHGLFYTPLADDADADVVARGTASDLDLFVWGRVPPSALEVTGDTSLLDQWQERVKI